jgi:hypothetical protein
MKVSVTYTLNELQRITPNLRKEHFYSDCPKVKEALNKLFWNLGCTLPDKPDIVEGVVTMNRFNEEDSSIRITVNERVDENWIKTRFASHQVRCLTDDVSMMKELDQKMNQRSFDVTTGTELV